MVTVFQAKRLLNLDPRIKRKRMMIMSELYYSYCQFTYVANLEKYKLAMALHHVADLLSLDVKLEELENFGCVDAYFSPAIYLLIQVCV